KATGKAPGSAATPGFGKASGSAALSGAGTAPGSLPGSAAPSQSGNGGSLEPVVVVSAPATLRALEERGFDLGSQLVGTAARSAQALAERAAYRVLAAAVAEDVAADRRRDAAAGIGMRYAHRQFNPAWLRSEKVRWELIAVVNRLDRRPFAPEHC